MARRTASITLEALETRRILSSVSGLSTALREVAVTADRAAVVAVSASLIDGARREGVKISREIALLIPPEVEVPAELVEGPGDGVVGPIIE